MQIEVLKTSDLTPYARNARTHSEAQVGQIAASIKEFGFNNPVLIDETGSIIAGHGRVLAAQKLALKEVPCIRLSHLSPTQRKAYILADNKLALNAGWDEAMLSLELAELKDADFDLALIGFDEMELEKLTAAPTNEGLTDPDEVPEAPEEPVTKLGDIWQLGNHRLMCGDSTNDEDVKKLSNGSMFNLWLTDPPYNVAYEGKTKQSLQIQNDKMNDNDFVDFIKKAVISAIKRLIPGACFYVWHANNTSFLFQKALIESGLNIRQHIIWVKNSLVMGRQDYHYKHEPCLYGWKDGAAHNWYNDKKQTSLIEFDRPSRNGEHPTMKPVALFEYQMLNNTKEGDIVLDSFGGSGTTMIAAEKNGRIAYLMELDPKYCDVIIKRWEDFTGRKAELTDAR